MNNGTRVYWKADPNLTGTIEDFGDGSSIGVAWDDWNGELGYELPEDICPLKSAKLFLIPRED